MISLMILTLIPIQVDGYQERIALDRMEYFAKVDVNLSWSINVEAQKIYVEIIAPVADEPQNQWIAFGISDTGGMNNSNQFY